MQRAGLLRPRARSPQSVSEDDPLRWYVAQDGLSLRQDWTRILFVFCYARRVHGASMQQRQRRVLRAMSERDPYVVLQVDPSAHPDVISAAYRALVSQCHADSNTPDEARMAQLDRAYEELTDPLARARVDWRGSEPTPLVPQEAASPAEQRWRPNTHHAGVAVLDFGRYAGWRLRDLVRHDPDYLRWLARHSSGIRFRKAIKDLLPNEDVWERRSSAVG